MISPEILKELDCLKPLNEEQIRKISEIAEEKTFDRETFVQRENDKARAMYVVVQGRVAIEIDLPKKRKVVIYIVQKGDLFGWSAVVPPHIITAGSFCMENTTLIEIPREPLLALMEEDPSIKASIMETVSQVVALRLKDTRLQLSYLLGWD
ncbi:MAG: cyclic nucleotide-binding domain-containing protein [Candidatus Omnitrophota bacterium]|jgi:CRP-like cAMP-binding protein|nr:MAG: cyclic nucleotide-binding domain-containing protein [Candidatus Omnitrophota bacterium]